MQIRPPSPGLKQVFDQLNPIPLKYIDKNGEISDTIPGIFGGLSGDEILQALLAHIENDQGYWSQLLGLQNQLKNLTATVESLEQAIFSLNNRVLFLENQPEITTQISYDLENPTVLKTPPLIGLLGLEIGGVNLIGSGWTAPANGKIMVDGANSIGLLTPVYLEVSGVKAAPTDSTVVLNVLGGGTTGEVLVKAGDVITEAGLGNVTFYREVVTENDS